MMRLDIFFQTKKGLHQGDQLSPLMFNIVIDMLTILANRAKRNGQLSRVVPHLVDGGLSVYNMSMTQSSLWDMI